MQLCVKPREDPPYLHAFQQLNASFAQYAATRNSAVASCVRAGHLVTSPDSWQQPAASRFKFKVWTALVGCGPLHAGAKVSRVVRAPTDSCHNTISTQKKSPEFRD